VGPGVGGVEGIGVADVGVGDDGAGEGAHFGGVIDAGDFEAVLRKGMQPVARSAGRVEQAAEWPAGVLANQPNDVLDFGGIGGSDPEVKLRVGVEAGCFVHRERDPAGAF